MSRRDIAWVRVYRAGTLEDPLYNGTSESEARQAITESAEGTYELRIDRMGKGGLSNRTIEQVRT